MLGMPLVNLFHATGLFLTENKENMKISLDVERDQWHSMG